MAELPIPYIVRHTTYSAYELHHSLRLALRHGVVHVDKTRLVNLKISFAVLLDGLVCQITKQRQKEEGDMLFIMCTLVVWT